MRPNIFVVLAIVAVSGVGCGGPQVARSALSYTDAPAMVPIRASNLARLDHRSEKWNPTLYAENSSASQSDVLVFTNAGKTLKKTLSIGPTPFGLAVDEEGNAFAASGNGFSPDQILGVYKNTSEKLVQTLKQRFPFQSPVVDSSGNLYVQCALYRVCEYASSKKKIVSNNVVRRIALRNLGIAPDVLTTDLSGNLAVADQHTVMVFAPGATTPYWTISSALSQGGVAFDATGNLFVATGNPPSGNSEIAVYAPAQSKPTRVISDPSGSLATILRFDAVGDLFAFTPTCSGCQPPAVAVFAPGGSLPVRTITKGISQFNGSVHMAVDSLGGVFIDNSAETSGDGSIVAYKPSQTTPLRVIADGLVNPSFLAVYP